MYEELVKRLRYENLTVLQMIDLMDDAANAITEQNKLINAQRNIIKRYQAYIEKLIEIKMPEEE